MIKRLLRREKGFTMVEMMVVLIIIAVLIGGGIRAYAGYIENAKVTKAKSQISTMQAALDSYYVEHAAYPTDQEGLLNAGIRAADDNTLQATDPWGVAYEYVIDSEGGKNDNAYVIHSGYADVQGAGYYVVGEGIDGEVTRLEISQDIDPGDQN